MQRLLDIQTLLQGDYQQAVNAVARYLITHVIDWALISQQHGPGLRMQAMAHADSEREQQVAAYLQSETLDAERLQNWDNPRLTELSGINTPLTLPITGRAGVLGYLSVGLTDPGKVLDADARALLQNTAMLLGAVIEREHLAAQIYTLDNTVHAERSRLYAILQLLPVGISIMDLATRKLVLSNREMDRLRGDLGSESNQLLQIQYPDGEPLPPEDDPMTRALAGETVRNLEIVVVRANKMQTAIVAGAMPLLDATGAIEGALLLWQDVTTLKDAQHTRELLLSAASHELRTPLTSLLGFIQLLETRPDAALDRREKWLGYVGEKARYLSRLVEELINLSRAQTGWIRLSAEETDLRALVQIALAEARAADMTRVYRFELPAAPIRVMVDRQKITQAIQNLLNNAALYSPTDTPIELTLDSTDRRCRLSIRDYGIGIPLHDQQHIFQPFYRAEPAYKFVGAGLGLAVANSFVELHRGRLWVVSSGIPGEGATFVMELPEM